MLESEFNSIVTKSLNKQGGFGFKIPDERSTITGFHSKNPYDIYGIYKNHFVAWESKWMNKPQAFNFDRLEEHQIDNLIKSFELLDCCLSVFAIGIDFGRNDKRVFIWKNKDLYNIKERKENKNNIYKKEFEERKNYIKISKGLINFDDILNMSLED